MNEFQKKLDEKLVKAEIVPPKTFKITIEEHITQEFEVEATDIEEAMEIAEQKYWDGEFVVDSMGMPTARLMQAEDKETNETTEWVEF